MENQMWDYFPFPRIFCTTSKKKADQWVKEMTRGAKEFPTPLYDGQCTFYPCNGGENLAVIYVSKKVKDQGQRIALLAHEVSHLVDCIEESLTDERLDTETRAYCMQSAMIACLDQLGKKWLTR